MFHFLHYAVKVAIVLMIVGLGAWAYSERARLEPAEEWLETLRRADLERLEVLGTNTAPVVAVPSGDSVVVGTSRTDRLTFRIAGVTAPPRARRKHSEAWKAFEQSRKHLESQVLSNPVDVAYTFLVPRGGGVGGVYLRGTNVAYAILDAGMGIVHDGSLKSLPVPEQVRLLAAEKAAREARRGFWADTVANPIPAAR